MMVARQLMDVSAGDTHRNPTHLGISLGGTKFFTTETFLLRDAESGVLLQS